MADAVVDPMRHRVCHQDGTNRSADADLECRHGQSSRGPHLPLVGVEEQQRERKPQEVAEEGAQAGGPEVHLGALPVLVDGLQDNPREDLAIDAERVRLEGALIGGGGLSHGHRVVLCWVVKKYKVSW